MMLQEVHKTSKLQGCCCSYCSVGTVLHEVPGPSLLNNWKPNVRKPVLSMPQHGLEHARAPFGGSVNMTKHDFPRLVCPVVQGASKSKLMTLQSICISLSDCRR
jgi:hypothetical protein